jgi:hypothetical protein
VCDRVRKKLALFGNVAADCCSNRIVDERCDQQTNVIRHLLPRLVLDERFGSLLAPPQDITGAALAFRRPRPREPVGIFGWIALVPAANSNSRSMIRLDSSDAETKCVTRTASRDCDHRARFESVEFIFGLQGGSRRLRACVAYPFSMRSGVRIQKPGHFWTSRNAGEAARVKITISSSVVVLISWCKLTTLTPVAPCTIASITGRAVSIR